MTGHDLRILLLIFAASLVIASLSALGLSQHPSLHWDAAHYALLARNLAAGEGFCNEPGHPTAYRPPLYPAITAAVFRLAGERYRVVYLLQALMTALTVTGAAWFAHRIAGRKAMLLAGVLVSVDPSVLDMTGKLLTESTHALLLTGCLLLLHAAFRRESRAFSTRSLVLHAGTGLLFGIATLCRPGAAGWALLATAVLLFSPRRGRLRVRAVSAAVLLAAVLLAVVPWMARNRAVFGSPALVTNGGRTFWEFRHRDVPGTSAPGTPPEEFTRANELAGQRELVERGGDVSRMAPVYEICPRYHAFFHDQATIDRFVGLPEVEADREFYRMGLEYTLRNPARVFLESLGDAVKVFSPLDRHGRINPVLFLALPFLLLGISETCRRDPGGGAAVVTGLLSLLATSFLVLYEPRYRIPYEPLMLAVAAVGITGVVSGGTPRERRTVILLAAGYVLFALASFLTLSGPVTT